MIGAGDFSDGIALDRPKVAVDQGNFAKTLASVDHVKPTRELARFWIDAEGKTGRKRVRIVKSGFKYPHLRLEETVLTDADGSEKISLIRAAVADHLMVKLKPEVEVGGLEERFSALGFRLLKMPASDLVLVQFDLSLKKEELNLAMINLEAEEDLVAYAEPDYLVFPTAVPNDPDFQGRLWSLDNTGVTAGSLIGADIEALQGWDILQDASGVTVAITDSGVRYTHEDLAPNMWQHPGSGAFGWDAYDDDNDPMDQEGHGTHVAGTVGARGDNGFGVTGVAWKVDLMALRFIGEDGGATSDAIRVINYARENGADIINASWGGRGYSQALEDAIMACALEDIIVVAAAGNEQTNTDEIPHYPSSLPLPNIVSVASTDQKDKLSDFSNFGSTTVDLAAPGTAIWSCGAGSDSSYEYRTGTSMAAPHVSGALALGKALYGNESSQQLIERLLASTESVSGPGIGRRLNLFNFLNNPAFGTLHDDFANPYLMEGCQDYWCWFNTDATREEGEDQFSPDTGDRSFWFQWVAPADGLVHFEATAGIEDISVVAFKGSASRSMQRIGDNFEERPTQSSTLRFYVEKGQEYRFSLDSRSPEDQITAAKLWFTPENDFFDLAEVIGTESFSLEGESCGTTSEPFEQENPHAGVGKGHSLWWRWTAQNTAPFTINTSETTFDTVLAVYTGQKESLVEIASNDDISPRDWTSEVSFDAVAGTTYHIAVDTYRSEWLGRVFLSGFPKGELVIFSSPQDDEANPGDMVDFRVVAIGDRLRYIWKRDGDRLPWPDDRSTLSLRPVRAGSFGNYSVEVISGEESETRSWTLSPSQIAPFIETSPTEVVALEGGELTLNPVISGSQPMTYQWFYEGAPIEGATNQVFSIASLAPSQAGNYYLIASNPEGSVKTNIIRVTLSSGDALNWIQRRPGVPRMQMLGGLSHQGQLHFVTAEGYWLRGATVEELRPERLEGMYKPKGVGALGSKLVIYGQEVQSFRDASHNHLMISEDGRTWSKVLPNLPEGGMILDFAANDSTAVVIVNYKLYASTDLISWTPIETAGGRQIRSLEYASGLFVAVPEKDNDNPFSWVTSTDGFDWTEREDVQEGLQILDAESLRSANGHFFVISDIPSPDTNRNLSVTSDGLTWTHNHGPYPGDDSLAYYDGVYITNSGMVSSDGKDWNRAFDLGSPTRTSNVMIVHEGSLVRARSGSNGNFIVSSESALDFPEIPEPGVLISTNHQVINGQLWGGNSARSLDGIEWEAPVIARADNGRKILAGSIAHDGENYWVHGPYDDSGSDPEKLYRGPELTLLEEIPIPADAGFWDIRRMNILGAKGSHILVGANPRIWASQDSGATWSEVTTLGAYQNSWKTVATDSGFVIYQSGMVQVSLDGGVTWESRSLNVPGHRSTPVIGKAVARNGTVTLLDQEGYLHFSDDDGDTWTTLDLEESGWISMAPLSEKTYLLHEDGRVATSPDRASVVMDNGLTREGLGSELVSLNSSLFATVQLADGLGYYQAIVSNANAGRPSLSLHGMDEGSIHEPGSLKAFSWTGSVGQEELDRVTVYLDGVALESFDGGVGSFVLKIPEAGVHNLSIIGEASSGTSITRGVSFFSRSQQMRVVSYRPAWTNGEVKDFTQFQGAFYAGERHGRILRTGNGEDWDLAIHLPLATQGLASNGNIILALTEKALYRSRDGVTWESKSLGSVGDRFFEDGSPGRLFSTGGRFILQMGYGIFQSDDGFNWDDSPLEGGPVADSATHFKGLWIFENAFDGVVVNQNGSRNISPLVALGFSIDKWVASDRRIVVLSGTSIRTSRDGEDWQVAEREFENVRDLKEVDGHFFLAVGPNFTDVVYYTSLDGIDWRIVSRTPDRIHEGIWWSGNNTSLDGVDWSSETFNGSIEVIAFLGEGRLIKTTPFGQSPTYSFVQDDLAAQEVDFGTLFDGREDPEVSAIAGAKILTTEDGTAYAINLSPPRVSVRPPTGNWGSSIDIEHAPDAYFKGLFYSLDSQMNYWTSFDLITWELRSLQPFDGRDFSISSVKILGGEIIMSTTSTIRHSSDGVNFDSFFIAEDYDLRSPGNLIEFNDQIIMVLSQTEPPLLIHQEDGQWLPPANDFPEDEVSYGIAFVQNGRLHVPHQLNVWSTSDLIQWHLTEFPVMGDSRLLQEFYNTPVQSGLIFGSRTPQLYTLNTANEWRNDPELSTLNATFFEGRLFHDRNSAHWVSIDSDLSISIDSLTYQEVALNTPIDVELTISNQQASDFVGPPGSELRIWAFPGGINDYQLRVLLTSIDIAGRSYLAGEDQVLNQTVQLPDNTIPGSYRIAVELYRANDHFDDIPLNNLSKFDEALELEARELVLASNGEGEIQSSNASLLYANGALVSLNATAGKGAAFMGWDGDAIGTRSQITVTMDSDKEIAANFTSTVGLQVNLVGNGSVTGQSKNGLYPTNSTTTLTAVPATGWTFLEWRGEAAGTDPSISVISNTTKNVTAVFSLTFENWKTQHFTTAQLSLPSVSSVSADFDSDGLSTWQEYLHGSDPLDAASRGGTESVADRFFFLTYTRNTGAVGGRVESEGSYDLENWDPAGFIERILSVENGVETIEARLPRTGQSMGFLRRRYLDRR
ncbi:S8 family serine peptidase [Verrucomicrobiaceae bacterium 227]